MFKRLALGLLAALMIGQPALAQMILAPTPAAVAIAPQEPAHLREVPGVKFGFQLNPALSVVTTASGKVTAISDVMGRAPAVEGSSGNGPQLLYDRLGRPFMRFDQTASYLKAATGFTADIRGMTMCMVLRAHNNRPGGVQSYFSQTVNGASTQTNGGFRVNPGTAGPPGISWQGIPVTSTTGSSTVAYDYLLGSQLQVVCLASRTGASAGVANSGLRYQLNDKGVNVAQTGFTATGLVGYEVGRDAYLAGGYAGADIYDVVGIAGTPTDGQVAAIARRAMVEFKIAAVTDQILLEGDSITDETSAGAAGAGYTFAMGMTEPGAAWSVPGRWRVINYGHASDGVPQLITRRDLANNSFLPAFQIPGGRNIVGVQIGVNDASFSLTATQIKDSIVDLNYTTPFTTGPGGSYLPKGWSVAQFINIGTGDSARYAKLETNSPNLRDMLRDPAFLVSTASDAGNTYECKVTIVDLPLIVAQGAQRFDTLTQVSNGQGIYYDGNLHPTPKGTQIIAMGGETPEYGYVAATKMCGLGLLALSLAKTRRRRRWGAFERAHEAA